MSDPRDVEIIYHDDGLGLVHISEAEYAKLKQAEAERDTYMRKLTDASFGKFAIREERDELEAWKAKYENENMALKLKLKQAEELLERAWWAGHNEGYRTTFEEWKAQQDGGA